MSRIWDRAELRGCLMNQPADSSSSNDDQTWGFVRIFAKLGKDSDAMKCREQAFESPKIRVLSSPLSLPPLLSHTAASLGDERGLSWALASFKQSAHWCVLTKSAFKNNVFAFLHHSWSCACQEDLSISVVTHSRSERKWNSPWRRKSPQEVWGFFLPELPLLCLSRLHSLDLESKQLIIFQRREISCSVRQLEMLTLADSV